MGNHLLLVRPFRPTICLSLAVVIILLFVASPSAKADEALPSTTPDFPAIIRAHSDQLAKVDSDRGALNLFVSTIGPAIQLGDVARTLGAGPLTAKLTKELLLSDLSAAVQQLMGSLAAWHLASTVTQAVKDGHPDRVAERLSGSLPTQVWLEQQRKAFWQDAFHQLSDTIVSPDWVNENQKDSSPLFVTVLTQSARLEMEAMQASYQAWGRIRSWKERVREIRGQTRLCGTWQWIIHNHQQQHQEHKLSLLFPPPGTTQPALPGLAETIVLGENVYLRWEIDGRVQEDSLQFSKEGQRLEGTFVNSQGGWGSISGKRTAGCAH